jgi:hypothetical protein
MRMTRGLSAWWASATHTAIRSADSVARQLALAIVPVRSVVRVIDDHTPPMTVEWSDRELSYTDFGGDSIHINPAPITEGELPLHKALDVVTGFAMHEAAHGKHSRDRYRDLIVRDEEGKETPAFRPIRIAAWLWNLAEDVRIEDRTAREARPCR